MTFPPCVLCDVLEGERDERHLNSQSAALRDEMKIKYREVAVNPHGFSISIPDAHRHGIGYDEAVVAESPGERH